MEKKSLLGKTWKQKEFSNRQCDMIAQRFNLSPIISQILTSREIPIEDIENYLNPKVRNLLPNPFDFKDMEKAIKRVIQAIKNKETIAIFGDYDVDGATSSAILYDFLRYLDIPLLIHIPDREEDGYGPNKRVFQKFKDQGATLCITVDCGVTAFEAIEYANETGLETVVIDHHEAEHKLPPAHAIVNPKRLDDPNPHKYFAAVGVVFLFLVGLNSKLKEEIFYTKNNIEAPDLLKYLDLVALGTVCDVVPLIHANRAFVKTGLLQIQSRKNLGLKTLCDISGIKECVDSFHLGFILGPRINAGGRIGESETGTRLLLTNDEVEAQILANKLNDLNLKRKNLEAIILDDVNELLEEQDIANFIFLAQPHWHTGIKGNIASRLKEKYNRPTFIGTVEEDGTINGSCRSVEQIDMGQIILKAKEQGILLEGGGHKMAAGFSLKTEKVEEFKRLLNEEIEKQLNGQEFKNIVEIDAIIDAGALTLDLAKELNSLSPFGAQNEEPTFVLKDARLHHTQVFSNKHIKSTFKSSTNKSIDVLMFNYTKNDLSNALLQNIGSSFELAGKIKINNWKNRQQIQFLLEDAVLKN
ncbi:MAG: single-stranded-DNA-specific exonuclease RecJ [Rickettsiales bacterium]|jgi:single-stranded-DNA-specific exonuclease|nr:single-stranded-DNA-specific exonuclease RecJ [Rickettsiales bacterium]